MRTYKVTTDEYAMDPVLKECCLYVTTPTSFGGWALILRISEAKMLAPVWIQVYEQSAQGLIGLVIIAAALIIPAIQQQG